jgi:type IV secretion system protein VirB6
MNTFFTTITAAIDGPLLGVMDGIIAHGIAYVATILIGVLAVAIALMGIAIAAGVTQAPARGMLVLLAKTAFVVALATQATYAYWVRDLIVVAMPHDLSQLVGGAPSATAHSYDVILNQAQDGGWSVWNSFGWYDPRRLLIAFMLAIYFAISLAATCFGYGVWLLGHIMAVVYVAFGVVFLPCFLFAPLRPMFSAWIGALVSCVALQGLSIILATILVKVESSIIGQVVAANSGDVQMRLGMLMCAAVLFVLCSWFALKLPLAAAALCGGIHFSPVALSAATFGVIQGGARQAGRLAHAGIQNRVTATQQGLRPRPSTPSGPSASKAAVSTP